MTGARSPHAFRAMPRDWVNLLIVVTVAGAIVSVQDVAPAAAQPADVQVPVFASQAELVVVHVTVETRRGTYATDLPREAFRILEDGVPQRVDFFSGEDSPVTVGLLVDGSGSMREGRERVIAAVSAFAEASSADDEIFALTFNERVHAALPPSSPFTADPSVLRTALAGALGGHGLTALYDAISTGLAYVAEGHHPRRVLVVVGDGGDNASTATFDQVLKEAQASNAAIYTVGIIDPLDRDADPGLLERLARVTGGKAYFPRRVDDVDRVLQGIARDIRSSYTLGYVSSNSARDGQFRRVRVAVTDPARRSLRVRARDGYRAGGPWR